MSRRARRRAYPSDLTDAQWAAMAPMIPDAAPGGRPCKADKREIVEAILYVLRAGCAWRLPPHDFPPRQTVYYDLRRWQREGVWARVHHTPVMVDHEREGRDARRHPHPFELPDDLRLRGAVIGHDPMAMAMDRLTCHTG